jgi:uncharacterized membrane protein YidH (DUF202 family)
MDPRSTGLIVFGIVLLSIGLFTAFYEQKVYSNYYERWESTNPPTLPYQNVGIVLIIAGIALSVTGLLFLPSKRKVPSSTLPPT